MKKTITILSFLLSSWIALGQTTISGTVKEKGVDVIIGANIFIEGTFEGTSTDEFGQFNFTTNQSGTVNLIVRYLGYKDLKKVVQLDGTILELELFLKPEANTLQEITITAGAFEAGDEKKAVVLNSIDIATTAGANADISGALTTLPGVQRVGESGQLFVRGGAAYETRTFIDGMYVQNPYNSTTDNVPARGRFSPFIFKGTTFSTGAYSAEFGQALSSALLLNTQDVAEETITGVSLMTVGAALSHTQAWENTSLAVSHDYTNLAPTLAVLPSNTEFENPFTNNSSQFIFRHKTSKTGIFKAYANINSSKFSLYMPDYADVRGEQLIALKNNNLFTQLSFQEILNDKWSMFIGGGFSKNKDSIRSNFALRQEDYAAQTKVKFSYHMNDHVVFKFGGEGIKSLAQESFTDTNSETVGGDLSETFAAGFVESDIYFNRKWVARIGVRSERSGLLNRWNVAPRFSVAYQINDVSQFSFASGKFFQTPVNELLRYTQDLKFEQANHFILNYQRIKNRRTLRIEAYHKGYKNLVRFDPQQPWITENSGDGYARGIDIFYRDKKTIKNSDFWVSYSFLDTERNYRDFPHRAMPRFASKHNATIVYKKWISKLSSSLGVSYAFSSPRPYFNPNHDKFHSDRTPAFHDLSVNWTYVTSLFKQFTVLHISASNVLGLNQTFGYQFSDNTNEEGVFDSVPVQSLTPQFFFAGLFISIGKKDGITIDEL